MILPQPRVVAVPLRPDPSLVVGVDNVAGHDVGGDEAVSSAGADNLQGRRVGADLQWIPQQIALTSYC